ncbi:MAG: acetyl-CoA carboxylase biotin carboxyl carrier protein [Candidatus Caenarcaniphilales bacterium]|nr:acetyl-CoA carboxylase biotin carboxyl carrier protein [Candidatus Caenarcaniphilales bacterium]
MLSYDQILELIEKLVETPLSEISISQGEFSVSLKKENQGQTISPTIIGASIPGYGYQAGVPAPAPIPPSAPVEAAPVKSNLVDVTSPMVGTFYSASSPDSPIFVNNGQKIKIGDTLCIIEAMKVMNELPAEISGTVEEICANNGQTVEYGQVLFRVKLD